MAKTFPDVFDMNRLSEKLSKLSNFKANVLRTVTLGTIEWEKVDGKWKGGVKVSQPIRICRRRERGMLIDGLLQEGKGMPVGSIQAS